MRTREDKSSRKLYVSHTAPKGAEAKRALFQQLMTSNRYGESRAAYREVQERHEDIKKIEKTLTELAQLFQDVCIWPFPLRLGPDLTDFDLFPNR